MDGQADLRALKDSMQSFTLSKYVNAFAPQSKADFLNFEFGH